MSEAVTAPPATFRVRFKFDFGSHRAGEEAVFINADRVRELCETRKVATLLPSPKGEPLVFARAADTPKITDAVRAFRESVGLAGDPTVGAAPEPDDKRKRSRG